MSNILQRLTAYFHRDNYLPTTVVVQLSVMDESMPTLSIGKLVKKSLSRNNVI